MGEHQVERGADDSRMRAFMKSLLNDLGALERMLETGRIESGVRRVGAEQEMFLIDSHFRPAPVAVDVIERVRDARITTEIARFNLEANLTPRLLEGDCFRRMEEEVKDVIGLVRDGARASGADVLLAGILPTLQRSDLQMGSITPSPRYYQLNDAIMRLRGGAISAHIKGLEEVNVTSDNIMLLSSNTSFQVHLQVAPAEFVPLYNMAQAVTAPVLAAAVNSPLWLGNRLWHETRLAIFQHSADARSRPEEARGFPTRVGFGERWLEGSVVELFREDIARFRPILAATEADENPLEVLERGGVPRLRALCLHNGTVWWWNRPCYGVSDGKAHLRIENRVLPSGPTTLDEIANAAFFVGLMTALPEEYGAIDRRMRFDDAKSNLWAAARHGLKAQLTWVDGRSHTSSALILEHLLPLARAGLEAQKIDAADIELYLGTLEARVRTGQTGAQWSLDSLAALGKRGTRDMRHRALASAMHEQQRTGEPVHRWPVIEEGEPQEWSACYRTVGQFMSTDLFTMRPDDLVDLAASVMDWRHIRHVPVEDERGRLVGLLSHRTLLRLLARGLPGGGVESVAVREIMKADPVTVAPATPTLEAIELMRTHRVGCLPVVE
ncbi:MAG TPA: glutamate-cysteine ligase family protein, partial [Pyrinomonadaceae bacterium]|nr:glutamate-cysteine ligase family protein [Pyrinomonadaceae bacterium]